MQRWIYTQKPRKFFSKDRSNPGNSFEIGTDSGTKVAGRAGAAKEARQLVDRYFELTLREGNRRALVQRLRQREHGADAGRVARITQPTLILWGAEDRLIPPAVGEDFARRIAGSRLVVLPGLGHVPHEEDPRRSFAPLRDFLGLPAAGPQ